MHLNSSCFDLVVVGSGTSGLATGADAALAAAGTLRDQVGHAS